MKVEQWLSRAMTVLRNLVFISPFWLSFVLAVEYYQVAIKVLELWFDKFFSVIPITWWRLWIFIVNQLEFNSVLYPNGPPSKNFLIPCKTN